LPVTALKRMANTRENIVTSHKTLKGNSFDIMFDSGRGGVSSEQKKKEEGIGKQTGGRRKKVFIPKERELPGVGIKGKMRYPRLYRQGLRKKRSGSAEKRTVSRGPGKEGYWGHRGGRAFIGGGTEKQ